jgi:hypothetical protein
LVPQKSGGHYGEKTPEAEENGDVSPERRGVDAIRIQEYFTA